MSNREAGIYEVVDKLLGHFLCEFSDAIQFLSASHSEDRVRRLKDINQIKNIDDESASIYHCNLIDDYYPNRPEVIFY